MTKRIECIGGEGDSLHSTSAKQHFVQSQLPTHRLGFFVPGHRLAIQSLATTRRLYLDSVVDYNQAEFRLLTALGEPASEGL